MKKGLGIDSDDWDLRMLRRMQSYVQSYYERDLGEEMELKERSLTAMEAHQVLRRTQDLGKLYALRDMLAEEVEKQAQHIATLNARLGVVK